MKVFKLGFGLVQLANSQTEQVNLPPNVAFNPQFAQAEEEKATSESWELGKFDCKFLYDSVASIILS